MRALCACLFPTEPSGAARRAAAARRARVHAAGPDPAPDGAARAAAPAAECWLDDARAAPIVSAELVGDGADAAAIAIAHAARVVAERPGARPRRYRPEAWRRLSEAGAVPRDACASLVADRWIARAPPSRDRLEILVAPGGVPRRAPCRAWSAAPPPAERAALKMLLTGARGADGALRLDGAVALCYGDVAPGALDADVAEALRLARRYLVGDVRLARGLTVRAGAWTRGRAPSAARVGAAIASRDLSAAPWIGADAWRGLRGLRAARAARQPGENARLF